MSSEKVRVLNDNSLRDAGFIDAQLQAAAGRDDAYVGELEGIKYYRAEQDIKVMGEFKMDGSGRSAVIIDQQGEGANRPVRVPKKP